MDSGSTRTRIGDTIESARRRLAIEALKKEPEEVVRAFLSGNDVFVSLPTGHRKSLCFAMLPLVYDWLRQCEGSSIVVIVTPLQSLMVD